MSNMARIFFAFTNSRCCMLLPFFAKWCATMSMARINPVDDAPFVRFVSDPQFVAARADCRQRSGKRHRQQFAVLQQPDQDTGLFASHFAERRCFERSAQPKNGLAWNRASISLLRYDASEFDRRWSKEISFHMSLCNVVALRDLRPSESPSITRSTFHLCLSISPPVFGSTQVLSGLCLSRKVRSVQHFCVCPTEGVGIGAGQTSEGSGL